MALRSVSGQFAGSNYFVSAPFVGIVACHTSFAVEVGIQQKSLALHVWQRMIIINTNDA